MIKLTKSIGLSEVKRFALSLGLLSLLGCAGPPAQHYTLSLAPGLASGALPGASSAPPAANARVTPSPPVGRNYTISDISVPAEVDNLSLIVRQGDGRLLVLADDRWTGSLSSQLSTALSQSLTQLVGTPPLQKLPAEAANTSVSKIQLDVQRFDLVPGQYVALDAVWSVRAPTSKSYLTCFTSLKQPVGVGVLALVQGQQVNVQTLSGQIAQALMSQAAPAGSSCTILRQK